MAKDSERIVGLYERHALAFDRDRGRSLFEKPWLDRFLSLVPPGGRILDLGCGAGEPIARYFIESGCQVTGGVDASPTLISICEERFPGHGWTLADSSFGGEPIYHANLDPHEYRALLREHGFEEIAHVAEDPGCNGHTVWLARAKDTPATSTN